MATEEARALIEVFRRATASPAALREFNRQGIRRRLARGDAVALSATAGVETDADVPPGPQSRRWSWIGVTVACAAALVTVWLLGGSERWLADPAGPAPPSSAADLRVEPSPADAIDAAPSVVPATLPPLETPTSQTPAPQDQIEAHDDSAARGGSRSPPPRKREPLPMADATDVLAAELAAITAAKAALARGDAKAALARILDYQSRFATGSLAEEGWVLRIRSLCRLDQPSDAAGAAAAFAAAFRGSAAAAALVRHPCRENR